MSRRDENKRQRCSRLWQMVGRFAILRDFESRASCDVQTAVYWEYEFAMARKASSRMDLRRQAEALEARGESVEKPKKATKKATTTRAKRTREKAPVRKRLVWIIYNGSMKEEARFNYDQLAEAEERIEALRQKSKKLYFIQPLKEPLGEPSSKLNLAPADPDDDILDEAPEELAAEFEEEAEIEDELSEELGGDDEEEEEEEEESED